MREEPGFWHKYGLTTHAQPRGVEPHARRLRDIATLGTDGVWRVG